MGMSPNNAVAGNPAMDLVLASAGSYPHSGPGDTLQVLVRARAAVARGEQTAADLSDAENFMVRRAIEEQVAAGFELVTDGLTRWGDPISHLAAKLEGVSLGAERALPLGGTYRVPLLSKRPVRRGALIADEYRFACNALGALGTPQGKAGKLAVKVVLTGPFTLGQFSEGRDAAVAGLEPRAEAFAEALAAEISALAERGAEHIQVDEFAPFEPGDWKVLQSGIAALSAARDSARKGGRRMVLTLALDGPGAAAHYDALFDLPVDVIALHLAGDAKLFERAASAGASKPVHLGLVSGRSAEMEETRELARKLEALLPKIPAGRAFLGPAGGLDTLPRDRARAKLELVARVREIVAGRPVPL
jgi:methionine synthase II (cobalamin-independent)